MTDRRYERLVRDQLPDAELLLEPMGRNTAAAIALATAGHRSADDEVMLVVPADAHIDPAREGVYRDVLRRGGRASRDRLVRHRRPARDARHPRSTRPATEYGYLMPGSRRARTIDGLDAYPLRRFEEKPKPARAEDLLERARASPGTPASSSGDGEPSATALLRYTGLVQSLEPMAGAPQLLERAYESIQQPLSIDHAVMEGAARNGQVVMASMDVGWSDLGSWTRAARRDRRARRGRGRPARRDRRRSTTTTSSCGASTAVSASSPRRSAVA